MRIVAGGCYGIPVQEIEGKSVSFLTEDGKCMFEVTIQNDRKSIEVRGITPCKVDGVLYREQIMLKPNGSNSVIIQTIPYE